MATDTDDLAAFDAVVIPAVTDYADPTHIPWMVWDVVWDMGNCADQLDDEEDHAVKVAALDAMPHGREAVVRAIEETVRHYAAVNGWSDYLIDPATGRYPFETASGQ